MAKQANRMMIGGFVVVAVFLLAASIVVFGSGKFFEKTDLYVMYFESSVKGLAVGSPVLFRGVPIGSVKSLILRTDPENEKTEIPIIIEVVPGQFEVVGGKKISTDYRESLQKLVDRGLRAVLSLQSLITGQLAIELDFYPGTPANLHETDLPYPQVPTIPSTTQRLAQALQNLDLKAIEKNLTNTLHGIDTLVNNPNWNTSLEELKGLVTDARRLVHNLDSRSGALSGDLEDAIGDARRLINNVDHQVSPMAANVNRTLEDFGQLARNADQQLTSLGGSLEQTLAAARGVVSEEAPLVVTLQRSLQEISTMARAFRELADYLERHPEALIQGKSSPGGN
ncbi:MAG: MCE family protein [Deltaproteobacteria bacterium]|jgi:paraquat-inducible protein B|nr:MCE family protein [Deltaproteobacteria bacterium]